MFEIVQADEKVLLSDKSRTEIMKSVCSDPCSCCLRGSPAVSNDEIEKYWAFVISQHPALQISWSMKT